MAIQKQAAAKTNEKVKVAAKTTPVKAAEAAKATKPTEKKVAVKPAPAKSAPVSEKVAVKAVAEKPSKKPVAKQEEPSVKNNISKKQEVKKNVEVKPVATKKAAEPEKKNTKKPEVAKKTTAKAPEVETKKASVKKAIIEVEAPKKTTTPKKEKEVVVKAEPKSEPVKAEPVKKVAKPPVKKVLPASSLDRRAIAAKAAITVQPTSRPMATPAARSTEKKPNVIIAHRRMENKSKQVEETEELPSYQPEIYRSLLDEPLPPPVTVYRYNDDELVEFRELISNRLEVARKELIYLQGVITRKDEAGTEDTENRYMNMEDGSGAMEREQLAQLASRQIQFVNHLEKALIRIENKTYGICRVTGKLIEKARLRAVPHATLSIEAKKMMNTKQN